MLPNPDALRVLLGQPPTSGCSLYPVSLSGGASGPLGNMDALENGGPELYSLCRRLGDGLVLGRQRPPEPPAEGSLFPALGPRCSILATPGGRGVPRAAGGSKNPPSIFLPIHPSFHPSTLPFILPSILLSIHRPSIHPPTIHWPSFHPSILPPYHLVNTYHAPPLGHAVTPQGEVPGELGFLEML